MYTDNWSTNTMSITDLQIGNVVWLNNGAESVLVKIVDINGSSYVGETLRELPNYLEYHSVGSLVSFDKVNVMQIYNE